MNPTRDDAPALSRAHARRGGRARRSAAASGCRRPNGSRRCWAPARPRAPRSRTPVTSRKSMAQEFTDADRSPTLSQQRNGGAGLATPIGRSLANAFADYRLVVDGLVDAPASLSLAELARAAEPHADHAPRLRRGLERDREVEGRAARRAARVRAAEARRRASSCSIAPIRWRTTARISTTRASISRTRSIRRRSSPTR